jgi:hypothetical protein
MALGQRSIKPMSSEIILSNLSSHYNNNFSHLQKHGNSSEITDNTSPLQQHLAVSHCKQQQQQRRRRRQRQRQRQQHAVEGTPSAQSLKPALVPWRQHKHKQHQPANSSSAQEEPQLPQ